MLASLGLACTSPVASGQGFPNVGYSPAEVGTWIAEIDAEGDPDGDGGFGLLPQDGSSVIGINQVLFHRGYMIAPIARNAAARGSGTRRGAMASFDISDLSNIKRSFFQQDDITNEIREAHGLVISSGDILCINTIRGVQFWDVSDPTEIKILSDLRIPDMISGTYGKTGWWVMGQHPYYYLGSTQRGLHIINGSDPRNPVVVKRISGPDVGIPSIGSVHCIGNLMVLGSAGQSDSTSGPFATLDISDPLNPQLLDQATGSGNYSVGVYGNYITTHGGGGLKIWDMTNPTDLRQIHHSPNMTEALYSCFADKHFHIPNFRTYEKYDFPIPGPPLLVSSNVAPIEKVHEFTEKLGNLIVATGGGNGDGAKFIPHDAAPDTQAPEINFVNPTNLAINRKVGGRIGVIVTDTLDFTTVNSDTFMVREVGGGQLAGNFSYSRNYLNFIPAAPLKQDTTYEVMIPGGGIKDIVGNGILPFSSRFSTGSEVVMNEEPGVVITSPVNGGSAPSNFALTFSAINFSLGSEGRSLAWFVDGVQRGTATNASPISVSGLPLGQRTIRIDLLQGGVATGLSASTTFTVIPRPPNQAPLITLVTPMVASPDSTVSLDASQSFDPDNGPSPLSFRWELLGGPGAVTIASDIAPATTVKLAGTGDYDLRLTLSDGDLSTTRDFRITVRETPREVLMVTPTGGFAGADVNIRNHLAARGLTVVGITPQSITKVIAERYGLVLVSATISSTTLNIAIKDAAVPLMICESYVLDDLGMTARVENVDFGNLSLNKAFIRNPSNDLTGGLVAGETTVISKLSSVPWGRPGPNAIIGAATASGQALVFGYEKGIAMVTGNAPARRLGMMLGPDTFPLLTPASVSLFNNAIDWMLGTSVPVPVPVASLAIISPATGSTVIGSFPLAFTVTNFELGSDGRSLAWFVDGVQRGTATSASPISISGLAAGPHTIRIDLLRNAIATGVAASVNVMAETPPPAPNQAPRITFIAPTVASPGSTVVLDASQSSDPDNGPNPLTFRWELLGGPGAVTIASDIAPATTVKLAGTGDYDLRLTLGDGNLTTVRDFRITVRETPREVLMVTPTGGFAGADVNIRNHLAARGLTVVGITPQSITKVIAERHGLVLVSATISSPTLNIAIKDAAVPLMICESYVLDDLGLTARVENVDFGNLSLNKGIIRNPPNELTAGLAAGESAVSSKLSSVPWGRPGPNAIIGAATAGGQALVFGYEPGIAMVTGNAPARRLGMMLGPDTFPLLTPAGLSLFNNALDWMLGTSVPVPIPVPSLAITSPTTGSVVTGSFPLAFTVTNFELGSDGRSLAWFVDGIQRGTATSVSPISISGLAAGPHTIRIDLMRNAVATGVAASVAVTAEIPPPAANQAPRITFVAPTVASPGSTAVLDASQSSDPDNGPNPLTFRWEMLGGPAAATFASTTTPSTTVKLAGTGDYDFRLTLGDGNLTITRDFRITVRETPREVLMVTPTGGFAGADSNIRSHLVARGLTVVGIKPQLVTKVIAERYGLVLVSASISSPTLNFAIKDAAVPLMICESYVLDDLGLTARVENVDFGNLSLNKAVIRNPTNELTAGLAAGEATVFSKLNSVPWGRPGPNAIIGASTASGQALVFGYEEGIVMATGIAPARRLGMMLGESSFPLITTSGLSLFNNALDWVLGIGVHEDRELDIPDTLSFGPLVTSLTPVVLQAATVGGTGLFEYSWELIGADGVSVQTAWSTSNLLSRTFPTAGNYTLILRVRDAEVVKTKILRLVVHAPLTVNGSFSSSGIALVGSTSKTIWNVNPDNDSVTVLNAATLAVVAEIPVAADPRTLSVIGGSEVWVASHDTPAITIISQSSRAVVGTIQLPRGSAPEGMVIPGNGSHAYVALRGAGGIAKIHLATRQVDSILSVLSTPKGLAIDPTGASLYATHFISPNDAGKVTEVNLATFSVSRVIDLAISTLPDTIASGRGLPNYLAHPGITPDGASLLIPSKQDNIQRGLVRDGSPLTSENSVRAIVSKVNLATGSEILGARWDINDSDSPNAVAFSQLGNMVFVSLQGTNTIAILDAYHRGEISRFEVAAAPDALLVDRETGILYVHHFLDRSVAAYAISNVSLFKDADPTLLGKQRVVATEKLAPQILLGKKVFYNAGDVRMTSDGYISCASCHLDGDSDGRVWDFTNRGEGLRNTTDLRGRAGTGHGPVHWSANFDEIQDFENDIRNHFDGLGFLSEADFAATSSPLGAPKAGRSTELDALAAYLVSLDKVPTSPYRNPDGSPTAAAVQGREVFKRLDCASCHSGDDFTDSASRVLHDVGTLKATSGKRLGAALPGIDTPTLKGLWATAPYFHDGSARTLLDVIEASGPLHGDMKSLTTAEMGQIIAYLNELEQPDINPGRPIIVAAASRMAAGDGAVASPAPGLRGAGSISPTQPPFQGLSTSVVSPPGGDSSYFEFRARRRKDLQGMKSVVETSVDCRVWKVEAVQEFILDDRATDFDLVEYRVKMAGRQSLFMRIQVK